MLSARLRTFGWMATGAMVLAGCLFPSFEGMEGGASDADLVAKAQPKDATLDGGSDSSPTAPSGSTSGASDVGAVTPRDPGSSSSGGSGARSLVSCGSASCDTSAGQVCCVGPTSATCRSSSSDTLCLGTLKCDTSEQCPSGQVCCASMGEAKCTSESACFAGMILCKPSAPRCPGTRKCNAPFLVSTALSATACSPF